MKDLEVIFETFFAAFTKEPLLIVVMTSLLLVGVALYAVIVVAQSFANNKEK